MAKLTVKKVRLAPYRLPAEIPVVTEYPAELTERFVLLGYKGPGGPKLLLCDTEAWYEVDGLRPMEVT